jgi:hypothetical protein
MFHRVCGVALENAALVTTRWDVIGDERAVDLEQELVKGGKYFKPLCDAGAVPYGHNNTRASALRIMNMVLNKTPIVLQIQEELTKEGLTIGETAAGGQLNMDQEAMEKKHEKAMENLRLEKEDAIKANDEEWQEKLDGEVEKRQKLVKKLQESKEQLKKPPYVPL